MKDAFKKAAQAAFTAAGDIKVSSTYRSYTSGSSGYNPATGTTTAPYTDYTADIIYTKYLSREIGNSSILPTDVKAMVPVDNLTPTPKLNDVIIKDSVTWHIINIAKDAADALYTFQIRQS
jgi:hypothetical protein